MNQKRFDVFYNNKLFQLLCLWHQRTLKRETGWYLSRHWTLIFWSYQGWDYRKLLFTLLGGVEQERYLGPGQPFFAGSNSLCNLRKDDQFFYNVSMPGFFQSLWLAAFSCLHPTRWGWRERLSNFHNTYILSWLTLIISSYNETIFKKELSIIVLIICSFLGGAFLLTISNWKNI